MNVFAEKFQKICIYSASFTEICIFLGDIEENKRGDFYETPCSYKSTNKFPSLLSAAARSD